MPGRNPGLILLLVCMALLSSSFAQLPFATSRGDNSRSGANTNETVLTPANVNKTSFGKVFTAPVDYVVIAQPLYVPNVNIAGGIHNVVYVVTQADSVYAFDADTGAQLWYASMLYGGTTASGSYLPCGTSVGFSEEGIPGTPVIDPTTNTMYLVAKTVLNTTVRHHLHALDITTGNERAGSPALIKAQTTSNKGHVMNFNSLYQKNRPGLLLLNGVLYMGFGSNLCNGNDSGWMLSYDPTSLSQLAVFNTAPDWGITSIWQSGNGIAADEAGNIFVETAEAGSHGYDVPSGGQTYCNSVLKLAPDLALTDYFTPWDVAFLNSHDLDLSSAGVLILPDQTGPYPHELVAAGKQGWVYVLDRDSMGGYFGPGGPNDTQIIQEFPLDPAHGSPESGYNVLYGSPAYWNNTVYFNPEASPLLAFPVSGGLLGTPLTTSTNYGGNHSPSISANGNTNGILWVVSGPQMYALNAVTLQLLYSTGQATGGRDTLGTVGHFVSPIVAGGRAYVAAENSSGGYNLEAYGLFDVATVTAGGAQTATVGTALSAPIQVQVVNALGQPDVGATVNFSDGAKGGSFSPPTPLTADSNGNISTTYTVPKKAGTYTLTFSGTTISGTPFANVTTTATAAPGAPTLIIAYGGSKQTGAAGSNLANPLVAQVQDANKNGVPGVTINFTANKGAVPNPSSVITGANGLASTTLQLPTTVSTITVTPTSGSLKKITFTEYSVAGPAANIAVSGGNNQSAPAGTQLPQALTVLVTDQYLNPVSGVGVAFSDGGAGGTFSNSDPVTGTNGITANQYYTLPPNPGPVTINATVAGVANLAVFNETGH